jgi:hypothetical protein
MEFYDLRWHALTLVARYKMLDQQVWFLHTPGTTHSKGATRLDEANCLIYRYQLGVPHISFRGI